MKLRASVPLRPSVLIDDQLLDPGNRAGVLGVPNRGASTFSLLASNGSSGGCWEGVSERDRKNHGRTALNRAGTRGLVKLSKN